MNRSVSSPFDERARIPLHCPGFSNRGWLTGVVLLVAALAATGWSCSPQEEQRRSFDLVTQMPFALLRSENPDRKPRTTLEPRVLSIPFNQAVRFPLQIPAGARLEIAQLRGPAGARLKILIRRPGEQVISVGQLAPADQPLELDLPSTKAGLGSLVLLSVGEQGDPAGRLVLQGPRLSFPTNEPVDRTAGGSRASQSDPSPAGPQAGGEAPSDSVDPALQPPNLVIYLVDTLRADHLGIYGYDRDTSPVLDQFAKEATVFDQAVAQSPWTRASVASIFTGLEPHRHEAENRSSVLPQEAVTLAELLQAEGYTTLGLVANGNIGSKWNFDQGFDLYQRSSKRRWRSEQSNQRFLNALDKGLFQEPFFLYFHTLDPHAPYQPQEDLRHKLAPPGTDPKVGEIDFLKTVRTDQPAADVEEQVVGLYDAEIASNDRSFGAFLDELRERGLYDHTLIVFVSDHGEEFWEHGVWGHGQSLYQEQLHVPLVIKPPTQGLTASADNSGPGQRPGRSSQLAQHIDLLPTLLDYAGVRIPPGLNGRSLRPLLEGRNFDTPGGAYSKVELDGYNAVSWSNGEWKAIHPGSGRLKGPNQLFHLGRDAGELDNLNDLEITAAEATGAEIRRHQASHQAGLSAETGTADAELEEELRALGYLQ